MSSANIAEPIQSRFDRPQDRGEKRALTVEHARHVAAERHHQRGDDRAIEQDLNPTDDGHGRDTFRAARA